MFKLRGVLQIRISEIFRCPEFIMVTANGRINVLIIKITFQYSPRNCSHPKRIDLRLQTTATQGNLPCNYLFIKPCLSSLLAFETSSSLANLEFELSIM